MPDSGDGVEFFTESMHAAQFPEEQHDLALRDYFLKKYGSRKLDLIVGVMGPAVSVSTAARLTRSLRVFRSCSVGPTRATSRA